MSYLYHIFPKKMTTTVLHPLSKLKKKYPDIYAIEYEKYLGREHHPEDKIPFINCKWKDVINMVALNPQIVVDNLKKAGGNPPSLKWYKIPISILDKDKLVVFLYREDLLKSNDYNKKINYVKFEEENLEQYKLFPKSVLDYYKKMYSKRKRPLIFHLIPHVLYRGNIDVVGMEVIETK